MREIIFDTETTGFDHEMDDRMVEIGCIEMVGKVATGRNFHAYFNPERDMPVRAFEVHGLSTTFLSDKPLFGDVADDLLEFLGDAPLVAHNASFDFGFLNMELRRCNRPQVSETRKIDTVALARALHPGAKLTLDALCSRYGIDRSHRVLHGALLDAELLAQLYVELTGGRQIGLELAADSSVDPISGSPITGPRGAPQAASRLAPPSGKPVRPARPHGPSAAELEAHQAFIAGIKDAIWQKGPPLR